MMRPTLIVIALLACSATHAEIYRWVDQDGHVQFSDRRNQGAEKIVSHAAVPAAEKTAAPAGPTSPDAVFLGPYTELEIVAPGANETLTQDPAGFPIGLLINPPLIEGHRMAVLLDGAELPIKDSATQFKLTGAALGSHRLQVQIRAVDGTILAQTSPRNFNLRQPKLPGQLP